MYTGAPTDSESEAIAQASAAGELLPVNVEIPVVESVQLFWWELFLFASFVCSSEGPTSQENALLIQKQQLLCPPA